nr:transporter substrate-binding domain-containing protein [Texcoconibacillus texcoconensis]
MSLLAACGDADEAEETPDENGEVEEETTEDEEATDEEETLVVATDTNYVPFEFMNEETGEMEGFDIDLIDELSDRVGFDYELEVVEFDGIVAGMGSGRYDIGIAGMTITEDRAEEFDFSIPYYDAGLILAVHEDNEDIQSIDDIDDLTVATRSGTTSEDFLHENTEANVQVYPQILEAYMDVEAGRADAAFYDVPNVRYHADTEGEELKTVGDIEQGEVYGIAFEQDSEWVEPVNEALEEMFEDGTYGDFYEEWFGDRVEEPEGESPLD